MAARFGALSTPISSVRYRYAIHPTLRSSLHPSQVAWPSLPWQKMNGPPSWRSLPIGLLSHGLARRTGDISFGTHNKWLMLQWCMCRMSSFAILNADMMRLCLSLNMSSTAALALPFPLEGLQYLFNLIRSLVKSALLMCMLAISIQASHTYTDSRQNQATSSTSHHHRC